MCVAFLAFLFVLVVGVWIVAFDLQQAPVLYPAPIEINHSTIVSNTFIDSLMIATMASLKSIFRARSEYCLILGVN